MMTEFREGDKVRIINKRVRGYGKAGSLTLNRRGSRFYKWRVNFLDDDVESVSGSVAVLESEIEHVEPKFEVGDWVEIVDSIYEASDSPKVGQKGQVVGIIGDYLVYSVDVEGATKHPSGWSFLPGWLIRTERPVPLTPVEVAQNVVKSGQTGDVLVLANAVLKLNGLLNG